MTKEKFETYEDDGETFFKFEGSVFSIIKKDDHPISNITAQSDRGRFLFHEKDGFVSFYAVQEIDGSRCEPHITF